MTEATRKDSQLSKVILVTKEGWPVEKHHCPKEIAEFWNHRCELSALDGLVFKGEKLVVPRVMRPEMLRRIHTGHLGIEKCKKRTRDVLFWPGMNAQIQELVSKCVICLESTAANHKEPLINRRITSRTWEAVATDLFVLNGEDYLLVVEYCSRYPEIEKLENTLSWRILENTHVRIWTFWSTEIHPLTTWRLQHSF